MKLAGMVGRPLGDLKRAGDFSHIKDRSIKKKIIAYNQLQLDYSFVKFDKFIHKLFYFFICWDLLSNTVSVL